MAVNLINQSKHKEDLCQLDSTAKFETNPVVEPYQNLIREEASRITKIFNSNATPKSNTTILPLAVPIDCPNYEQYNIQFVQYIKRHLPEELYLYALYMTSGVLGGRVYPTNFDQTIIEANLLYSPVTTITILKQFVFVDATYSDIIYWCLKRLQYALQITPIKVYEEADPEVYIGGIPYKNCVNKAWVILCKLIPFKHWDNLKVCRDTLLYTTFIGNKIISSKVENLNLEQDIITKFGDFIQIIFNMEDLQLPTLMQIFNIDVTKEPRTKREKLIKTTNGDCNIVIGDNIDTIPIFDGSKEVFLIGNSESTVNVDPSGPILLASLFNDESVKFIGISNRHVDEQKYKMLKLLYEELPKQMPLWSALLSAQGLPSCFSILQTKFTLKDVVLNFIKFINYEIFFVDNGVFWNGVKFHTMQRITSIGTSSLKMAASISTLDIKIEGSITNPLQSRNFFANIFTDGQVYYPFFDVYEIATPAFNLPTRNLSSICLDKPLMLLPRVRELKPIIHNQFFNIVLFYNTMDQISFISTLLHHPFTQVARNLTQPGNEETLHCEEALPIKYDGEEFAYKFEWTNYPHEPIPVGSGMFKSMLLQLNSSVINALFDHFVTHAPALISDLLNVAMASTVDFLELDTFGKVFFDSELLFAESIGAEVEFLCAVKNVEETYKAPQSDTNIESGESAFLASMVDLTAKLQDIIKDAQKPNIETTVKHTNVNINYYSAWIPKTTIVDKIHRIQVFELMSNFNTVDRTFDFSTIDYETRKQLVIILMHLSRCRPKKIATNHVLYNSSIMAFLRQQSLHVLLLRRLFPMAPIKFTSTSDRFEHFMNFANTCYTNKLVKSPIHNFKYWKETAATLFWLFQFSDLNIQNFTTLTQYIKYIESPYNFFKLVMYCLGSSNSSKTQLLEVLHKVFNCMCPTALSESALNDVGNELNNALLPMAQNYLVHVDEFSKLDANILCRLSSLGSLSSRLMHTQNYKDLPIIAKLFLVNNIKPLMRSNQGVVTRLLVVWITSTFRDLLDTGHWGSLDGNPLASEYWVMQRITRVFPKGCDEQWLAPGMFLLIRHYFSIYFNPDSILSFETSPQYAKYTREFLQDVDPYLKFMHLLETEKPTVLKNKSINDLVELLNERYNLKWNDSVKKSIITRYYEDRNAMHVD